jgi:hypothetical protein
MYFRRNIILSCYTMEDVAVWIFVTFAVTLIVTKYISKFPDQCAAPQKKIM